MQIPPSQTWTLHSTTGLNSPEPCYECAWAHCKPASAVTSLHILHSSPQTSIWACRDSFKRHGIGINTHKVKGNKWWGILEGTGKEETESKWLVQKEKNKKSVSVWHFQVSSRTEKSEDSLQKTAWQQVAGGAMVPWQGIRKPQGLTTSRVRLLGADGSYLRKGWAEPRSVVPAGQIGGPQKPCLGDAAGRSWRSEWISGSPPPSYWKLDTEEELLFSLPSGFEWT